MGVIIKGNNAFDMSIVSNIRDVESQHIKFQNIYFKCKSIEDAGGTIFVKRKRGKWIKKMRVTETEKYTSYDPDWYCACCGAKYDPHIARMVNFCYVCGADMRTSEDK